jgi:hypothetical protein
MRLVGGIVTKATGGRNLNAGAGREPPLAALIYAADLLALANARSRPGMALAG